jgi:NTP pyrophosphatase (non-canonical NTP hydrolase)
MKMNFKEYTENMKRTAGSLELNNESLCWGAMGISGEAGEVTDYLKKVVFHKHELNKEKLAEELGDVLWYLACTAELIGYDLEKVAEMNIEKLKKRYPEGWDIERSKNR